MPLHILLIMVTVGISLIVLVLHLSGCSAKTVLSAESAHEAWLRQFPEDEIQQVLIAQAGHAALVQTSHGMGLVWAFGADTVARLLTDIDLIDTPHGLRVDFHEFAAPNSGLTLTETERADWRLLMKTA